MSGSQFYGPSIELMKLYTKVSQKTGNTYMVGRLAGARVTVLPNTRKTEENNHAFVVLLSQADPYQSKDQAQNGADTPVLPFPPRPAPGPQEPVPPWDPPPAARAPYQQRQSRPDGRKRVAGGGPKTQLIEDSVPFAPEVR